MIRINLLPGEYGHKSRTPVKFLVSMAAAIAINSTMLAYWGWTVFGVTAVRVGSAWYV